ncbi:MAG TPA: OmpH family outer membrane protein [Acidisarcina sp.]
MKRSLTLACILASGLGVNAIAQTGAAAPDATPNAPGTTAAVVAAAGPSKVGVIMFEQAVGATNEGQRNFGELQKKYQPKQAQLKAQSDEIDTLTKQSQATTISETQRETMLKSIDDKKKALQRAAEDAQTAYQSEASDTFGKLAEKFFQVMQAYAEQNGYTLVLDATPNQQQAQQTVLWAPETVNITVPVIQAYNVKSGVPAPAAAAPSTPRATTPRPAAKPPAAAPKP